MAWEKFQETDTNRNGKLEWNNGEIQEFVRTIYQGYNLNLPETPETTAYLQMLFLTFDADKNGSLDWRESVCMVATIARSIASTSPTPPTARQEATDGGLEQIAEQTFRESDWNGNGVLEWNNGEIREFVRRVSARAKKVMPREEEIYKLYDICDVDKNRYLDEKECVLLVSALSRMLV